ncbi:MAG: type II and III secretion system protein family protein [Bauldia sp.]|nr:type II and III secretion system protein family protein [Bauldia sp.]MCW5717601.1 type II and III secretion system protein family protein [Bauldia sp.]
MFAKIIRGAALAGFIALAAQPAMAGSPAEVGTARCQTTGAGGHQSCTVPLNKSLIIDLPRDARDVLVSNPGIADVVVRTARRVYLTGIAVGQTSLFIFDTNGDTIVSLDLTVERDISGLADTLRRLIPGSNIAVEMINDNILLAGTVQNAADSRRAEDITAVFANAGAAGADTTATGDLAGDVARASQVVNLLTIEGEEQVFLKVTIAEVERTAVRQLGVSWGLENFSIGEGMVFGTTPRNYFPGAPTLGAAFVQNIIVPDYGAAAGETLNARRSIGPNLQALEQTGLMRTLAEPTLTAISGESASFLAGGEFPVPVGVDPSTGAVTVEYKMYGVSLEFTPVVLSEGRISIHVFTEVSELSVDGGLTVAGVTLPGLKVRRAETTLELPSGGALVMSGLLQDNVRQTIQGLPGIRNLPILGALFGSRDYQHSETELIIIVTPYLVNPVAPSQLARPDDGLVIPAGAAGALFNQLNLRYGVQGQATAAGGTAYQGNPGFIIP